MKPHFCLTATGFLVYKGKILLIKHKKLGVWLMPGGHIEENEMFHEAAEREFWEETNVKVRAYSFIDEELDKLDVAYQPLPFRSTLAWVCEENFALRKEGKKPLPQWKRGCEKHFDYGFLVEPVASIDFKENVEETDGIAWFSESEIDSLDTFANVKSSIKLAFKYAKK